MSTRFYFQTAGAGTPTVSPSFDAGWEDLNGSVRRKLEPKTLNSFAGVTGLSTSASVPITTTADYAIAQYISDPLKPRLIDGTFSFVASVLEADAGVNATLALVVKVVSQDGGTTRGTLYSVFGTDTEYAISSETRIVNAVSVTPLTILSGDRLVIELGAHISLSLSNNFQFGINSGIPIDTADFALTSGLTTSLRFWAEFSQDILPVGSIGSEKAYVSVGNGMSRNEQAS